MSTTANSKSHRDHPRSPLRLRHARRRPDHPGDQRRHSARPTGAVRVQRADGLCGRPLRSYRTGATGPHGAHRPGRQFSRAAQPRRRRVLDQDVVWVLGGSVAGLLAMWHLHGVDAAVRAAWRAGVVPDRRNGGIDLLARGRHHRLVRAGPSTCHQRTRPRPLLERCAYDSEPQRRPFFQRLVADGTLPAGYATDDGAGVLYRGTEFVEAVSECDGAAAYLVDSDGARAVERRLDTRRL